MTHLTSVLTLQAGLCLVGCLQLVAFTSLLFQFPYLYGRHGLQPISTVLVGAQDAAQQLPGISTSLPSLLWLHSSLGLTAEALLAALLSTGWALAAAAACGVVRPLVFTALWVIYLSFKSLGGDFLEYGDEVLLEVSFAAIWLALAHQQARKKQPAQQQQSQLTDPEQQQQQQQPAQALSSAARVLVKWLLFRLLLVGSTFSATYLCARDPALRSCWKTLVAHGLPHAATRWLAMLPGPVAAVAAAVTLLELPVAFALLAYAPALQRLTALALLALQLPRLLAGPASLANLATAVLCFLLLDDELWVPALLRAAEALPAGLRWWQASTEEEVLQEQGQGAQIGGLDTLSRQSSLTSLFAEPLGQPDELGASVVDTYGWTPIAAAGALVPCAALLLSYDSRLGLLLRPTAAQLLRVLQAGVPVAMLAFLGAAGVACWHAVSTAVAASRAAAAQAREGAQQAAAAAEAAGREAEKAAREAEQAAQRAGPAALAADGATPVASPQPHDANGVANDVHEAEAGEDAAAAAAAEEEEQQDGVEQADAAAGSSKAAAKRGRAGGKAAASKAPAAAKGGGKAGSRGAAAAAAAAATESPKAATGGKARTVGQQFADLHPGEQQQQAESPGRATPKGRASAAASSKGAASKAEAAAAAAAAAAAERAKAARQEAAAHQQEAAAAAAAVRQHARHAKFGAWVPAAAAVAVAVAVLAVFVSGAPQLLTAVSHSPATISRFLPGPAARLASLGHTLGLASGSSRARAAFLTTQRAAAAAGPGAVVQLEAYVSDTHPASGSPGAWQKVPLRYSLGSGQVRARSSLQAKLQGARGWLQLRLQGHTAAAAAAVAGGAGGEEADVEQWLMVLADKLVQGSPSLHGLLDQPVQQHDFVTVSRAAYTPGHWDWRLDAASTAPAVSGKHRSNAALKTWAEVYTAVPGNDGPLVAALEACVRRLSGPWVLAALLVGVLLRHLLLPGGLLHACHRAAVLAAATGVRH